MDSIETKVAFKPLNNCLMNLPANFINPFLSNNFLVQNVVVELSFKSPATKKKTKYYCGWNGYFSNDNEFIEIDPIFGSIIGLKENKKVNIQLKFELPKIQSVELEPETSSDWELTELYAQTIEDKFLNQIRCLSQGQQIVVFPNSNSNNSIKFIVKSVKSGSSDIEKGILGNDSELHIQPKVFRRDRESNRNSSSQRSSQSSGSNVGEKRRRSVSSRRSSQFDSIPSCLLRSISLPHTLYDHLNLTDSNYEVYIDLDQDCINSQFKSLQYVQISLISGPGTPPKSSGMNAISDSTNNNNNDQNNQPNNSDNVNNQHPTELETIETRSVIARLIHDHQSPAKSIGLSKLLSIALGVESRVGDLICIEAPSSVYEHKSNSSAPLNWVVHKYITSTPVINEISLKHDDDKKLRESIVKKELNVKLQGKFKELSILGNVNGCPITNGVKLPIIPDLIPFGGYLELKSISNSQKWCLLRENDLPNIEFGEDQLKPESFIQDVDSVDDISAVVGQDKLIKQIVRSLKRGNSSLIYGSSGCGKTVLIEEVSKKLFKDEGYYIKSINCDSISNDNFNNLKNLIENSIKEINWHSPSLIIFENLDSLIPKEMEQGDSGSSKQVSELLISKFVPILQNRKISLLCSSKSKDALNSIVFQTHLLEDEYHLRSPDKDLRKKLILNYILSFDLSITNDEILNDISIETEGYLPSDLKILCDRTYHDFITSTDTNSHDPIKLINFQRALEGYVPSSLRGVKLQKSNVAWSDIGGLVEAKRVLLETLEWPTKYSPIFANCPLRLRSGILLYGYPGCGKTYLASAIASQCGLNFISIKGPEILNKYIGASEQSIRELFERASSAKPCILFFDEFDSIAPKRGHDSTGVTDRVVNQLLTQMDGAEGLDGVYVLAATSRPDLIDSALLRPGRLDKSILCDLPDYENRLDIIKTVVDKFSVKEDVDLEELALKTDGFSGADLQALVYNSYLKAVHENLDEITKNIESNEKKSLSGANQDTIEFFTMVQNLKKNGSSNLHGEKVEISKQIESIYKNLTPENTHDVLSGSTNENKDDGDEKKNMIVIKWAHFQQGLQETKKSISSKELKNFERIYTTFVDGKREGNLPNGEASTDIGGRSTLM